MTKTYSMVLFTTILLLSSCVTNRSKKDVYFDKPDYKAFFTTGLKNGTEPINNVTKVSINEDRIYIYVKWFGIPNAGYRYNCKIYDGSGEKVADMYMDLTVTNNYRNTWTSHNFNKEIEKPGPWKFEIYIDNNKILEKTIEVETDIFAAEKIADNPISNEAIELLELTGSYKLALQAMTKVMNDSRDEYNRNHPNKQIPDEIWARVLEIATSEIDKTSYYKMMVPIYEKYLTKDDLREIITFYKSDTGRKFTSVLPDILKEGMSAARAWGQEIAHRIRPKIEEKLREMGYPAYRVG